MKLLLILTIIVLLMGCEREFCQSMPDNTDRQRIFKECMQLLPKGPEKTHYNDWDEVVEACDETAAYQANQIRTCRIILFP